MNKFKKEIDKTKIRSIIKTCKHKFVWRCSMITTMHIKNIGIIQDIMVDFNEGLNILTGETGAGKTLIIDSLAILAGR